MRIYTNLEKITISESLSLESFEGEEWKELMGFWNYEISNYGRVKRNYVEIIRSDGQFQPYHPRIIKQCYDGFGYKLLALKKSEGKRSTRRVHILVADYFVPNPENKPEVNHIKEIKNLNWFDELEWATRIENCNHGTRNKRKGETFIKRRRRCKPILKMNMNGEVIKEYYSAKEASKEGFSRGHISSCISGKRTHHKGFKWAFK